MNVDEGMRWFLAGPIYAMEYYALYVVRGITCSNINTKLVGTSKNTHNNDTYRTHIERIENLRYMHTCMCLSHTLST